MRQHIIFIIHELNLNCIFHVSQKVVYYWHTNYYKNTYQQKKSYGAIVITHIDIYYRKIIMAIIIVEGILISTN